MPFVIIFFFFQDLKVLVLNMGVLALAKLYTRQNVIFLNEGATRKKNRHAAYRHFVL